MYSYDHGLCSKCRGDNDGNRRECKLAAGCRWMDGEVDHWRPKGVLQATSNDAVYFLVLLMVAICAVLFYNLIRM